MSENSNSYNVRQACYCKKATLTVYNACWACLELYLLFLSASALFANVKQAQGLKALSHYKF